MGQDMYKHLKFKCELDRKNKSTGKQGRFQLSDTGWEEGSGPWAMKRNSYVERREGHCG